MSQYLHSNEKEQFRKLFKHDRIDRFEEMFNIVKIFLKTEDHVTLVEFLKIISDYKVIADDKLVKDTLTLMCKYGFARKHQFDNGSILYEHMHLGQHHDHMICVKCNRIFEFEDDTIERLQIKIASKKNFHVLQHKMELYGICSMCMIDHEKLLHLSEAQPGENLLIKRFSGCKKSVSRLTSLGLRIGDEINIIANSCKGQVVISCGNRRLILCREFAKKILVSINSDIA